MADYHVRVILEAINKGSGNLRNFLQGADKDTQKLRTSLRGLNQEIDKVFTQTGVRGRDPLTGRFVSARKEIDESTNSLRRFRNEARQAFKEGPVGQFARGFSQVSQPQRDLRKEADKLFNASKEERARRLTELQRELAQEKNLRDKFFEDTIAKPAREEQAARSASSKARESDLRSERQVIDNQLRARQKIVAEKQAAADEAGSKKARAALQAETAEIRKQLQPLEQERDVLRAKIASEVHARQEQEKSTRQEIEGKRRIFDTDTKIAAQEARRAITAPNRTDIFRGLQEEARRVDQEISKIDNRFQRFGARTAKVWSDFKRGAFIGHDGITSVERDLLKGERAATRFGAAITNAFRRLPNVINIRFGAIIGIIQLLGAAVVQLGSGLVALAASAAEAGAALGGAFAAGISQAIPVVGLLAAALSRVQTVIKATSLADQAKGAEQTQTKLDQVRQATQRLADARYALKQAGQAVNDAEYEHRQAIQAVKDAYEQQRDAIKNLAEVRRQAARDIVDANFEERDAALSLKDAEFAVLDAKRQLRQEELSRQQSKTDVADAQAAVREAQARLAQVRQEGDQAEISQAIQNLALAKQNLAEVNSQADTTNTKVDEAKLKIKQADLAHDEAVVRNKRAQEDAKRLRKEGVEGQDQTIQARRQLRDSYRQIAQAEHQVAVSERGIKDALHSLAIARREEKDAEIARSEALKKGTTQQQNLNKALANLSPAEKQLFKSLQNIKKIYKDNFRPITDIIISAISRAVDRAAQLLQDPKILNAFRRLATSIAGSIDRISKFTVSPEFRHFLEFSINEAAKNVPKLTDAFENLLRTFIRISRAATPLFDNLLGRFDKFTQRITGSRRNQQAPGVAGRGAQGIVGIPGESQQKRINDFFSIADRHLQSWIRFAEAVGKILGLLTKFAAPAGKGLLDDLTTKLNDWSKWMKENPGRVRSFFRNVRVDVEALSKSLGLAAKILFQAFSSKSANELSTFLLQTVIPAFAIFLDILGQLAKVFNTLAHVPVLGQFIKISAQLLIVTALVKKLFPLLGFGGLAGAFKAVTVAGGVFFRFLKVLTAEGGVAALAEAFPRLAAGIRLVGTALKFVFITNPWIGIIIAIIAAVVLLDRKFHFLAPTIKFIGKIFMDIWNWIKDHWKLLLAILLAPFAPVVLVVVKFHKQIIGFIEDIINWVREHWKLLVAILLAPFAIGGAIILGLIKFHDKIINFFKNLVTGIVNEFKKLPGQLEAIFKKIPGLLLNALKGLGGIVKSALHKIPIIGKFFGGGGEGSNIGTPAEQRQSFLEALPTDKARAKARKLQGKGKTFSQVIGELFKEGLLTEKDVGNIYQKASITLSQKFQHGGDVQGRDGQAVPIIAHAGEWVLNKSQQETLARKTGTTRKQLQGLIFGPEKRGLTDYAAGRKVMATRYRGPGFYYNLRAETDPDNNAVYFIEFDDGTFGNISPESAAKIIRSNGHWFPPSVKRDTHGFTHRGQMARFLAGGPENAGYTIPGMIGQSRAYMKKHVVGRGYKLGGVVTNYARPALQSFAAGGTVLAQPGVSAPMAWNKNINQHFEINTQGETDWNYVMRIGAMHAQEAM